MNKDKKEYLIQVIIPALKRDGVTLEQISEELDYRNIRGIEYGMEGWDDGLIDYSTEELSDVEVLWDEEI